MEYAQFREVVSNHCCYLVVILFSNDTTVLTKLGNALELSKSIKFATDYIKTLLSQNGLKMNESKTKNNQF